MKCPGCGEELTQESQRYCIYCGAPLTSSTKKPERTPRRANSTVMRLGRKADFSCSALPDLQEGARRMTLASLSSSSNVAIPRVNKEDKDMPRQQDQNLTNLLSKLNHKKVSAEPVEPVHTSMETIDAVEVDDEYSEMEMDEDLEVETLEEPSFPELIKEGPLSGNHPRVSTRTSLSSRSRSFSRPTAVTQSDEIDLLSGPSMDMSVDFVDEDEEDDEDFVDSSLTLSSEERFFDEDIEDSGEYAHSASSGPIPTASGTFARTPSGGFKLVWTSVKTTCSDLLDKARQGVANLRGKGDKTSRRRETAESRQKRQKMVAIAFVIVALLGIVGLVVMSGSRTSEIPTENSVAMNETNDFELVALDDSGVTEEVPVFDAEGFADSFDFVDDEADPEGSVIAAAAAQPNAIPAEVVAAAQPEPVQVEAVVAPAPAPEPEVIEVETKTGPKEIRKYGKTDNLFIGTTKSETFKAKRSCVMREGPASRFPFAGNINTGDKVEILTTTDEDWLYSNGVWTKAGQADRLGPGTQFAAALKGQSVAAPTSRVISAKSWRYVKVGKVYGYVGPACFK